MKRSPQHDDSRADSAIASTPSVTSAHDEHDAQSGQASSTNGSSSEVSERSTRRRFTAKYKQQILRQAAAATQTGALAALLRREGLYSSHLTKWRAQLARLELQALEPKRRGPKVQAPDPRDLRILELERQLAQLDRRAVRAEAIIDVQKKLSQLLGITLPKEPETT